MERFPSQQTLFERQNERAADFIDSLVSCSGACGAAFRLNGSEPEINVAPDQLLEVARRVKTQPEINMAMLIDLCGVDFPDRKPRFEVVIHLLSPASGQRLRIKVPAGENEMIPSLVTLWPAAAWFERECWDLFGIPFKDNPDLRRLLTDYDFRGHPLRKDFPLTGFTEVRYSPESQGIIHEPVYLPQAYRDFDFGSPWQGDDSSLPLLPGDEKAPGQG